MKLLLTLTLFFTLFLTHSRTIYISPFGNDDTGKGTRQEPYLTIGKAYEEANDGDTIEADKGAYPSSSPLILNKYLKIQGGGINETIFVTPRFEIAEGNQVYLDDFTLDKPDDKKSTGPVLVLVKHAKAIVDNIRFIEGGVLIDEGSELRGSALLFLDSEYGVYCNNSNVTIGKSVFSRNKHGARLFGSSSGMFASSHFINNAESNIGVYQGAHLDLIESILEQSKKGIHGKKASVLIMRATVKRNSGPGLFLEEGSKLYCLQCVFSENKGSGVHAINSQLQFLSARLLGNENPNGGGGLRLENSQVRANDTSIEGNESQEQGGGFFCSGGVLNLSGGTVAKNKANIGGAGQCLNACGFIAVNTSFVENVSQSGDNGKCRGINFVKFFSK